MKSLMRETKRRARVLAVAGVAVGIMGLGVYGWRTIRPERLTPTRAYFSQADRGELTRDEILDFNALRAFLDQGVADFTGYAGNLNDGGGEVSISDRELRTAENFKYGLAFTAYALANIARIAPSQKEAVIHYLDRLIQKMKQKVVWESWVKRGYGDDPVKVHNIMYKGHLNLMLGFYQLLSGRTTYAAEFRALTQNIAEEIDATAYHGVTCEPDDYYVQCNTIGVYSLLVYDKIYGTDHSRQKDNWLTWVKERMIDPSTGVFRASYHPAHDYAVDDASGYGSAWSIAFINAFDPALAQQLWDAYKHVFIQTKLGYYAFASERPRGKPDSLATLFALIAAKEMKDEALFDKLLNAIEKQATPTIDGNAVEYQGINKAAQGGLLFAKTNVGLGAFLREGPR